MSDPWVYPHNYSIAQSREAPIAIRAIERASKRFFFERDPYKAYEQLVYEMSRELSEVRSEAYQEGYRAGNPL